MVTKLVKPKGKRGGRRKLSPEARERIAAAQNFVSGSLIVKIDTRFFSFRASSRAPSMGPIKPGGARTERGRSEAQPSAGRSEPLAVRAPLG